jgi:ACS family hexuronate transporter-like MFS transporter
VLFATYTGRILEWTHSYSTLFAIAASAYLVALAVILILAPGLRRVESLA